MHACTQTYMDARMHTNTQSMNTHVFTIYLEACIQSDVSRYLKIYVHTYTHTYTHNHVRNHTCIISLHTYIYTHIYAHAYIHKRAHTNTHKHIHTAHARLRPLSWNILRAENRQWSDHFDYFERKKTASDRFHPFENRQQPGRSDSFFFHHTPCLNFHSSYYFGSSAFLMPGSQPFVRPASF
jgi:hypothetical protein